jgi:hypothetical protein
MGRPISIGRYSGKRREINKKPRKRLLMLRKKKVQKVATWKAPKSLKLICRRKSRRNLLFSRNLPKSNQKDR